uniref:AsIV-cont00154-ORF1 n=1 Tax=Apophua simplicipes ichnovirus TaxID=1329648 RepID=S5DT55_9VIRU|nr:AsIV-cont00154-ORF1 [Apophua simplicipes ichnovirus]
MYFIFKIRLLRTALLPINPATVSFKMNSQYFNEFICARNPTMGNYFHDVAETGSIALLRRVEPFLTDQYRYILTLFDKRGYQCVHIAARHLDGKKAVIMIEELARLGANVYSVELITRNSLLHIAVSKKNYELAEWLCQQPNFITHVQDCEHYTAYDIASMEKDEKMMMILRQYGGDVVKPESVKKIKQLIMNRFSSSPTLKKNYYTGETQLEKYPTGNRYLVKPETEMNYLNEQRRLSI